MEIARSLLPEADIRLLRHRTDGEIPGFVDGCFYHPDEALRFAPQAAIIANPAPFHLEISRCLASIGCHLLIEKPLSHRPQESARFLREANHRGVVLQVGYNLRFLRSLQEFRRLVRSKSIGRILWVHAEVGQDLLSWRPRIDYRQTVSAQAHLGGGVLLELSHEIDYLRWIFGDISWVSSWYGRLGDLEVDVEDAARLIFGFEEETESSRVVATLAMDFIRQDPTRTCLAAGSMGTLRWDGLSGKIHRFDPAAQQWDLLLDREESRHESYVEEWRSFLGCIKSGGQPMVTGEDGLAVLNIVEAAKLSQQQHGVRIYVSKIGLN